MPNSPLLTALVLAAAPLPLLAQQPAAGYSPEQCPSCAAWNAPHAPVRVHGNTYYVGTDGLAALLLVSPEGHILIDAGLPESAEPIAASIRALGFRPEDIRLIVTSHAHYDHSGGVASLQALSGARVAASPRSAPVLRTGLTGVDDPQHAVALAFPAAQRVEVIADGDTLRVGNNAIVAHFTPGHTPGGTSWSWRSCEAGACRDIVYADSQTPISADDFLFTRSATYPEAIADFERGHAVLERLSCDILLTPHPGASRLWERLARREAGDADALVDPDACRRYAAAARKQLQARLERERAAAGPS